MCKFFFFKNHKNKQGVCCYEHVPILDVFIVNVQFVGCTPTGRAYNLGSQLLIMVLLKITHLGITSHIVVPVL